MPPGGGPQGAKNKASSVMSGSEAAGTEDIPMPPGPTADNIPLPPPGIRSPAPPLSSPPPRGARPRGPPPVSPGGAPRPQGSPAPQRPFIGPTLPPDHPLAHKQDIPRVPGPGGPRGMPPPGPRGPPLELLGIEDSHT